MMNRPTSHPHVLSLGACAMLTAIVLAMPSVAHAEKTGPSFSCAKAMTVLDRAICEDPALSDLDLQLETAFRAALKRAPGGKQKLLEDQRQWLADRAGDCDFPAKGEAAEESVQCLALTYSERINVLEKLITAKPANEKTVSALSKNP
jgi:uncharacterized protein